MNELSANNSSQFLLYQTDDGQTRIEVQFSGETVWLSLNPMADPFHRDKSVISKHIGNVFGEGELALDSTAAKFAAVQKEGTRSVTREIEFYNLRIRDIRTSEKVFWRQVLDIYATSIDYDPRKENGLKEK